MQDPFARHYGPWALVTGASSGIGEEFAQAVVIPGVVNRLGYAAVRLASRSFAARMAGRLIKRSTGG